MSHDAQVIHQPPALPFAPGERVGIRGEHSTSRRRRPSLRLLGTLAMLASPMMLLEGIRFHFGQSELDFWMGLGGVVYILGWMCSAAGLRRLRATGDTRLSAVIFHVQMVGLVLAGIWTAHYVVLPNVSADTLLWRITDPAWPLSHLFMLVVGALVLAAGRLRGWRRFPALVPGLALPVFYALAALGAPGVVGAASFGVITTLGFLTLGYAIRTAGGRSIAQESRRPGRREPRLVTPSTGTLRLLLLGAAALLSAGCESVEPLLPVEPLSPGGVQRLVDGNAPAGPQVSAGGDHSCALRTSGEVECWGDNEYEQAPALQSAASGRFTQVTGGAAHTCALRGDGAVECWGYNWNGQVGGARSLIATYTHAGPFIQVTAGFFHTCAVRSDGIVECWGLNNLGQAPATKSASSSRFTQVSAGYWHSCALRDDGVSECWGNGSGGVLAPAVKHAQSGRFTQLSANSDNTCAVRDDGVVECWGINWAGQAPATRSATTGGFTQVTTGVRHTCALRSDKAVECWGSDEWGSVSGTLDTEASYSAEFTHTGSFTQVSAGTWHTCAVRSDGTIQCWGLNNAGQCDVPNRLPTANPGGPYSGSEGSLFTLNLGASDPDGDALTYSWNLGDGTTGSGSTPPSSHSYADNGSYTLTLTVSDGRGGTDTKTTTVTIANVAPTVSATAPSSVALLSGSASVQVSGGFSGPGTLDTHTATLDCDNGAGAQPLSLVGSTFSASCSYSSVGSKTVTVTVTDKDGGTGSQSLTVSVTSGGYTFTGFFRPVENLPVMNSAKAGSAIPVKFSLGGNHGLGIMAAGYPISQPIGCSTTDPTVAVDETVSAGGSSLSYDATADQYVYTWKTEAKWAGTCRQLVVKLTDGSEQRANFKFSR